MQLRSLDQQLDLAVMPSSHAPDQEHVLKQDKPAIHRLAVHSKTRSEARQVQQIPCRQGRMVHQARQFIALADRSDVEHVA